MENRANTDAQAQKATGFKPPQHLASLILTIIVGTYIGIWLSASSDTPANQLQAQDHYGTAAIIETSDRYSAGIPNAGAQRQVMVEQLQQINIQMQQLNRMLAEGRAQVRIKEEKK